LLTIPTLRKLVVGGNRMNDRQMVAIADALKTNTGLQTLDLQRNVIGWCDRHCCGIDGQQRK
jgi:Ran GTPase-activating protein (RanGAP) involved in mRNA processing and transport